MASLKSAVFIHTLLIGLLALEVVIYYPKLPDTVASHFGASGQADGWMSKQAFAALAIVFPVALSTLLIAVQASTVYLDRLPAGLINMPNKKYWLAPERRAETMAYMGPLVSRMMLRAGGLSMALIVIIMGLALHANLQPEPRLEYAWPVVVTFLGLILITAVRDIVQVYRRFGRIPQPEV
ncbi:MAG: DUF1648 domain-containing protein [Planctomycetes bacterium]|nr:DUF1648 domain-containing protein [Planctomycetota bacterium]